MIEMGKAKERESSGNGIQEDGGLKENNDLKLGKEKERLTITPKMLDLMGVMAEHDFLTIHEAKLIYSNESHAYKVLAQLKDEGILRAFDSYGKPKQAYCFTPAGYKLLEGHGKLRVRSRFDPSQYKSVVFNHSISCSRVRLILSKNSLITDYMPESMIWEQFPKDKKVPDGLIRFKRSKEDEGFQVAIEVELTLKNKEKLKEAFRELTHWRGVKAAWYICKDQNLVNSLRGFLMDGLEGPFPDVPFFYFTTLDLIENGKWLLWDAQGGSYCFGSQNRTWSPEAVGPEPGKENSPQEPRAGEEIGSGHSAHEEPAAADLTQKTAALQSQIKKDEEEDYRVFVDRVMKKYQEKQARLSVPDLTQKPRTFFEQARRPYMENGLHVFLWFLWGQACMAVIATWALGIVGFKSGVIYQSVRSAHHYYLLRRDEATAKAVWWGAVIDCAGQKTAIRLVAQQRDNCRQ
ncbi:MAG: hypothetical protein HYT79_08275 [Elusimicrobia bacterium]|nr:hypothetical protein [Elusimicrobiota bacterium]